MSAPGNHKDEIGRRFRALHKHEIYSGQSDRDVGEMLTNLASNDFYYNDIGGGYFEIEISSFETKSGRPELFEVYIAP